MQPADRALTSSQRPRSRPMIDARASRCDRLTPSALTPRQRPRPGGRRNALKHGASSAETLALKRQITALARLARETMAAIE